MTTSKPRPEPVNAGQRPRPSDERARLASRERTTRMIAFGALAIAVVGVVLAASRFVVSDAPSCQQAAWDAAPATADLPDGWTIGSTQFDINRQQVTLLGPLPQDDTTAQGVAYATITCFPEGAAEAVSRSQQAATDAGQTVIARDDLGDGGFAAADDNGSNFLQLRHGGVVVYLAASSDVSPSEVDSLASAYDKALGGDGGAVAVGTPDVLNPSDSVDLGSPDASEAIPSDAAAAPELEALLPTEVAGIALTVDSALGTDVLGEDQSSRAITAALRADGKTADDLTLAQAYDETQAADLSILVTAVDGLSGDKLRTIMLDSWLSATGAGVVRDTVTLAGKEFTRVDYGDEGAKDYVTLQGDAVTIITTASPELAAAAAAALP